VDFQVKRTSLPFTVPKRERNNLTLKSRGKVSARGGKNEKIVAKIGRKSNAKSEVQKDGGPFLETKGDKKARSLRY